MCVLRKVACPSSSSSFGCGGSSLATVLENLPLAYNSGTNLLDRTASFAEGVEKDLEPKPFKRGHMRRSSYESAQIQLDFSRKDSRARKSAMHSHASSTSSPQMFAAVDAQNTTNLNDKSHAESAPEPSCSQQTSPLPPTPPRKKSSLFSKSFFSRNEGRWWKFGEKKAVPGVVHTTGLILEERPSSLPAKSKQEAAQHRILYEQILETNKKKIAKAQRDRQRQLDEQKKAEDALAASLIVWTEEFLPNWNSVCDSKRCREFWGRGVPPKVRGKVWTKVIGNNLSITEELYNICCEQATLRLADETTKVAQNGFDHESAVEQIFLDVSRTYPKLGIFQQGGPYYELLLKLLGAYVCYRPDVGYVQSMSFLAAILLLQMEPFPAFVAFANLLNQPLQVAFFCFQQNVMTQYYIAFDLYFKQELPALHTHFDEIGVRPDFYLAEWIYTLFARSLSLDSTCKVWDVYLRDGDEFIFQVTLAILKILESDLLAMEFDNVVTCLAKRCESIAANDLLKVAESFTKASSSSDKRKSFNQYLLDVDERLGSSLCQCSSLEMLASSMQCMKVSKSVCDFVTDSLSIESLAK